FAKVGAVQCGFCIPGMVLAAESVLAQNASPSEDELRDGISGNLCRCTGYETIVEAIKEASNTGAGTLWPRTEKGEESDFE
ncbi:MAG: 2Fe-2S iron-sulfur cluster-binding protein, partial [Eubacteriales bacterium]|nr:2Fe-2S iron-sulfur cluster-binding protein [Eubacteriales bacterium]